MNEPAHDHAADDMHAPCAICHLDADAFFASVEQSADARLRGKPVAVGGEKRGIIASASYEARKFGVYTPMPTARARKLCPKLIVVPGDFERYEQFSHWMFGYCYDFTPDVEQTSIDEGYADLTACRKQSPAEIARTIRRAIGQSLKISVSEGIGRNKLVSQIASKLNKPAGFLEVPPGTETAFLHPLPNRWLPGVGPKTSMRLNAAGLAEIRHVAATPVDMLTLLVGKQAPELRQFANGIDERPLIPARQPAKSFSHQETFASDLTDEPYLDAVLRRMADDLFAKAREDRKSIRTLTVKVRYNDMAEDQCSESLEEPTDLESDVYGRLHAMLRQAWKRRVSIRMVSLKLSNVYDGRFRSELPLEPSAQRRESREQLARVVDELRRVHGHSVILRGHNLLLKAECRMQNAAERKHRTSNIEHRTSKLDVRCSMFDVHSPLHSAFSLQPSALRQPSLPLRVHSYYSFLDSTLSPADIVRLAAESDMPAVAMTDIGNLHGAAEFVEAARNAGVRPILGAELAVDHHPLLLYVESARGYHNLCRLLSRKDEFRNQKSEVRSQKPGAGSQNAERGKHSTFNIQHSTSKLDVRCSMFDVHSPLPSAFSLQPSAFPVASRQRASVPHDFLIHNAEFLDGLVAVADNVRLADLFPGRFYQAARRDMAVSRFPAVPCPPVHYATPEDRVRYDIAQSIRTLTLLRQPHPEKRAGGRYHFRRPPELAVLCRDHPDWVVRSAELADRCRFEFPFGKPQFPAFRAPDGSSSRDFLRQRVMEGLRRRYEGRRIVSDTGAEVPPARVRSQVETELSIIAEVGYDDLFLITWDLLQTCRGRGIEWITRGSAADSLVCYCLGISDVCPIRFGLYFRRFLNKERMALHKLPDIDVDFAHDRKDDVVNLLFEKYGPEHCAVVGGFSTFQARSAVADVAKVLGVSEFQIRRFTEHFPWSFGGGWVPIDSVRPRGAELIEKLKASPECGDLPLDEEPFRTAVETAAFLDGFPRHPKMHPCGVVLSRQPIHELTPTFISNKGWATTHFDMDAVEAMGLVKMDILAQGGLAVMRDVRRNVECRMQNPESRIQGNENIEHRTSKLDVRSSMFDVSSDSAFCILPSTFKDPVVWDLIASGQARAVHHIESPAMVSLSRMCNVREIDGLIAIVSVIRPGAANEQKKARFTRRYQGMEPPEFPDPSLAECLRSTFGLVVYEEHILQICEAFAGFDAGRADVLRRALVRQQWKTIETIATEFAAAARRRGHAPEKIREVWELVTGFSGYAFCKAHSTAYGVEAYQAAWLKRYYPAEFMAAVLTNGKGFYHPIVYVLECHRLGISLLPPNINDPGPEYKAVAQTAGLLCRRPPACDRRPAIGDTADEAVCATTGGTQNAETKAPFIRVPLVRAQGIGQATADRVLAERARGPFESIDDFYRRVGPAPEEAETMIRVGAFDAFGRTRTQQFWEIQRLVAENAKCRMQNAEFQFTRNPDPHSSFCLLPSALPLTEPDRRQRLQWEAEAYGFPASGHPLELHSDIAWNTYCPVARLGEHAGEEVTTCGLIVEQRTHHQVTGEPMKFLTLADWTGMVETELFAATYRSYGLATVRYPVLEVSARVEPYENGHGFSLRVLRAGKPRPRGKSD